MSGSQLCSTEKLKSPSAQGEFITQIRKCLSIILKPSSSQPTDSMNPPETAEGRTPVLGLQGARKIAALRVWLSW